MTGGCLIYGQSVADIAYITGNLAFIDAVLESAFVCGTDNAGSI